MEQLHEYIPDFLEWEIGDEIAISNGILFDNKNVNWLIKFLNFLEIINISGCFGKYQGVTDNCIILENKLKLRKIKIKNNYEKYAIENLDLTERKRKKSIQKSNEQIKKEMKNSQYNKYLIDVKNAIQDLKKQYGIES